MEERYKRRKMDIKNVYKKWRKKNIFKFAIFLLPIIAVGAIVFGLLLSSGDSGNKMGLYADNEGFSENGNVETGSYYPNRKLAYLREESDTEESSVHLRDEKDTEESSADLREEKDTEESSAPLREESDTELSSEEITEEYKNDISKVMKMDTIKDIVAKRQSSTEIFIVWNSIDDEIVKYGQYIIMRRGTSVNVASAEWEEIGVVQVGQISHEIVEAANNAGYKYGFKDVLTTSEPVQYEYRIDLKAADGTLYTGTEESTVLASNVLICIDPGHFKGTTTVSGENMYGYQEGIFTLQVGLALREELAKYGIASYLTRETDSITIGNYTNSTLDSKHLSLRGEYAAGSSLFLSIHTNANNDNVNGCDTWQQPLEINKTLVIVNQIASRSEQVVAIANEIGATVTTTSYRLGLSFTDQFERVDLNSLKLWTSDFNDSIDVKGTVCYRWGTNGDYYGVLRGAANVGVPGIIIEHGYHTVEEVRRQAMTEDLSIEWAKADAYGIAKGLGFEQSYGAD